MKKGQWLSKDKLKIVLEGLSRNIKISELCAKYQGTARIHDGVRTCFITAAGNAK